jgi:translocator assembly and maintenance protein 41
MAVKEVLAHFPPVRFAIAYGSGVFAQRGNTPSMVDLLFAVDDPVAWHQSNLERNSHHYSALRYTGAGAITWLQGTAAGLWFNPNVVLDTQTYKYGVITTADLKADLLEWRYLYASGRMQKPVRVLQPDADVERCNQVNLRSAAAVALLTLEPYFTEAELYHEITQLSYRGDIRMAIGEDPQKTRKIVDGSFRDFRSYYAATLQAPPFGDLLRSGPGAKLWEQDIGLEATNALLLELPPPLRLHGPPVGPKESLDRGLQAVRRSRATAMHGSLQSLVWRVTLGQTLKGLLTAGVSRSWTYALRKLRIGATGKAPAPKGLSP